MAQDQNQVDAAIELGEIDLANSPRLSPMRLLVGLAALLLLASGLLLRRHSGIGNRAMSQHLTRRCGCRDEHGRQLGKDCPKLKSDPKHGTWGYYLSHGTDPKTKKRRQFRKAGFATKRKLSQRWPS
jgi:hypothetical protein